MHDLVVKHFEGKPVSFRTDDGKLTLTMRETGELLGYKHPTDSISALFRSHKDEFDNDCTQMVVSTVREVGAPPIRERTFTIDGLILLCMFSEQPVAKRVRRWLRKIGKEVAVTGSYNSPVLAQILTQLNETVLLQGKMLQNLAGQVHNIEDRQLHTLVPANRDTRLDPTPAQRLRRLIYPDKPPRHFNGAGKFDNDFAQAYAKEFGGFPMQRERRYISKRPEWVIEVCPEHDEFLRRFYKKFLLTWPVKQNSLRLMLPVSRLRQRKEKQRIRETNTSK